MRLHNNLKRALASALFFGLIGPAFARDAKTITFASLDDLKVTADISVVHDTSAPFIVLFHQAGWSRGEYKEIMPKLNKLGFNCMAVDQRSGGKVNGVKNETNARATKADKATEYLDAYQDLQAALNYAHRNFARGKLIIWGSSYSAALVIKLAADNQDIVDGVLSFSPGEYFGSALSVGGAAKKIKCPVFITSAKAERGNWIRIFSQVPSPAKQFFTPETAGNHGSRALWSKFEDSDSYWQAVTAFLKLHFLGSATK